MTEIEKRLGFRIDVREGDEAGTLEWLTAEGNVRAVRPATGAEIRLWNELIKWYQACNPGAAGVSAHGVTDPFGTPKKEQK